MPTYGQIAHAIQDFSKTISDDSVINIDHIIFLMSKYRNYLVANYQKELSQQTYQTICVNLTNEEIDVPCDEMIEIVSEQTIPNLMNKGNVTIMPPAGFRASFRFHFVTYQKYQFVGHNPYLKTLIYSTLGPDNKIHMKSNNSGFGYLNKISINAIFEDIEKASEMECDESCENTSSCTLDEKEFPLDAELVPTLMQACVKDIIGAAWQPRDDENNANDELAMLAQILNRYTNNAAKRMLGSKDANNSSNQSNEA